MLKQPDLSKLSREEKLELLSLLEEKKRRDRERRDIYKPNDGQIQVHKSSAIGRFCFAGNGSGKSTLGVNEALWAVLGYNPILNTNTYVPCRAVIVLDRPSKADELIIPEIRKWYNLKPEQLHKKGKPNTSQITFDNGSTIDFMMWDANPMAAEGIETDWIWADEPMPRPLYVSLRRSQRTKGRQGRFLLTGTPISAPWLRTEVYEPWSKGETKDIDCFRFGTETNRKNLADGYIEQFSAVLSEKERNIRLNGEFFDLEGLALAHLFRRETHTIKRIDLTWDERNPTIIVMDPHPSKAHHCIVLGADRDNRLYVLEEYKSKAVARDFIKQIIGKGWFTKYRVLDIVYDSLGNSEMTSGEGFKPFGAVINEVLKAHGLGHARATSYAEKSDEDFIERIQDGLLLPDADNYGQRIPKLRIVADCLGSISNVENVQWAKAARSEENKPHLDISNQDFLSCLKYGLATNLYGKKEKDRIYTMNKKAYGVDIATPAKAKAQAFKAPPKKTDLNDWHEW